MNEKQLKNWEDRRSKGKLKFILSEGIAFGLIMAPLNALFLYLFNQEEGLNTERIFWQSVFWIPAGLFYGLAIWIINERQYRKIKGAEKSGN